MIAIEEHMLGLQSSTEVDPMFGHRRLGPSEVAPDDGS